MDDCRAALTLSFEGRGLTDWQIEAGTGDVDGFVDAWYADDGRQAGWASGTNLRQFFDGFAYGSGATVHIEGTRVGNLHHFYEALFRALGDAIRSALDLPGGSLAGDSSGLAGESRYEVRREEDLGEDRGE
jgi:imidazoleglycerol phosphate dehydratase HisB